MRIVSPHGDSTVNRAHLPVYLWVRGLEEGVSEDQVVLSDIRHKELMFLFGSGVIDFEGHCMGNATCLVRSTIHVFDSPGLF